MQTENFGQGEEKRSGEKTISGVMLWRTPRKNPTICTLRSKTAMIHQRTADIYCMYMENSSFGYPEKNQRDTFAACAYKASLLHIPLCRPIETSLLERLRLRTLLMVVTTGAKRLRSEGLKTLSPSSVGN